MKLETTVTTPLSQKKRDLAATEEVKKSHQPEAEKSKNIDNFLLYEAPLLRKHGKVNHATKTVPIVAPPFFDNVYGPPFTDWS